MDVNEHVRHAPKGWIRNDLSIGIVISK